MKKLSRSDWLIVALLTVMVAGIACAVMVLLPREVGPVPGDGERLVVDHPWELPEQSIVTEDANGVQKVVIASNASSIAWNTEHVLKDVWQVSGKIDLQKRSGRSDCSRILFGDTHGNIGMVVSVEYQKNNCVQLRVDMMRYLGWRTLYTTEKWVGIAENTPVEISAVLDPEERVLTVTLSQEGMVLMEAVTDKVPERVLEMLQRFGVGVYDSCASFSDFSVTVNS